MDLFLVYLWLKLDSIGSTLTLLCFGSGFMVAGVGLFKLMCSVEGELFENSQATLSKMLKWSSAVFGLAITLSTLLPSSKDVAILVGVHYVNKAIETPEAAKVQTLLRLKANEMLDKHIQEATKAASDSKN